MTLLLEKILDFFGQQPVPRSAFQLTSRYFSGIHISPNERKIINHFILPLKKGMIKPSFNKKNIEYPAMLEERIKEGLNKIHHSAHKIACLIPELSLKAFVFSFGSLPPSREEREQIIRFRVKKQIPLLPDDARFSFDLIRSNNSEKILATVARASIVKEYEDLFSRLRLKVRTVGVPTLSLLYLINREKEKDFLLVNIEEDSLSLIAIVNSEIALYRLKPFIDVARADVSRQQRIEEIVKEVENTVNFIEDRERKKIHSIWIRLGLLDTEDDIFSLLKEKLTFPLNGIETCLTSKLGLREKKILSPLIGQIL
ncbi:MAG: hypothetical protein H8E54_04660 [Candidatus Aminicenantes bacterium]|nr:hypothetical protein [Candidatus Aminicenantes bacterium]